MAKTMICILISLVADECNVLPFDVMFTYVTIALQLYEEYLKALKKYKTRK